MLFDNNQEIMFILANFIFALCIFFSVVQFDILLANCNMFSCVYFFMIRYSCFFFCKFFLIMSTVDIFIQSEFYLALCTNTFLKSSFSFEDEFWLSLFLLTIVLKKSCVFPESPLSRKLYYSALD